MGKAVALGLFDGVHLGHRAVLQKACDQRKNGFTPAAFAIASESVFYKQGVQGYIYESLYKEKLMREVGIEAVKHCRFDRLENMSGEEFIRNVLMYLFDLDFVCCGRDFRFGKDASCGIDELRLFGKRYGFYVEAVDEVRADGEPVSSSRIRRMLTEGDIQGANALLGRPYSISGSVVEGNHIGRTIDFPTINQAFGRGQLVPRYGVYSGSVCIDGATYRTVTNIGVKPTIEGEREPLAETHIIGWSGDLYDRDAEVRLDGFIRGEQRFSDLGALRAQIAEDISRAADI